MKSFETKVFIAFAAFLLQTNPAFAHAMLVTAIPAVGSTVSATPRQIELKFTEGVEAIFCRVRLKSTSGAIEPTGKPRVEPGHKTVLLTPVRAALKPGSYSVFWHAVSVDTHRTQGTFSFTIAGGK